MKKNGHDCLAVTCDVTNEESICQAVKEVADYFGHIDILVNNAGVVEYSSGLSDHTTAQWDKVLNTDLKGVFLMGREVSKVMMKQKYGRIINIASVGGIQAGPSQVSYFAALKRFGREGEMNGALIYFASDACTYTTGQLLVVDGGMTSML